MDTIKHNSWYLDVSLRQFLAPASHGTRAKENLRIGSKRSEIPRRGEIGIAQKSENTKNWLCRCPIFCWQKSFHVISQYFAAPEKSKVCVRCKAMCVRLNDRLYCSIFSISSPEPPTCI